jgi:molybdenum cofactor cytidylyltransferase
MGGPKPLLDFEGRTCLSLVLSACLGSRAEETVLVLGADADLVRAAAEQGGKLPSSVRVVFNDRHESGQTSTLKAGLESTAGDADGFMILPVDHPLITSDDVDALIERFEMKPRGRTIFIACHENSRGHPVLFASSHKSSILELGDDEPLHDYTRVREAETAEIGVANIGVVSGMNTPEEYRRLLQVYRDRAGSEERVG